MLLLTSSSFVIYPILFLICNLPRPSRSLPFDISSLIDPIQQSEQDGDMEVKRVLAKSVFNVPVRTEAPVTKCPDGSQRVTGEGPCVSMAPSISFGDKFLFDSIRNFYKPRPSPPTATSHRRRRPTTPRPVTTTTPRFEEGENERSHPGICFNNAPDKI